MSQKFDWHAEDDLNWDELSADEQTNDPSPKRRRWLILLLVLLLLAGTAGLILRQVDRRIDDNTQAMSADIISSYNLLQIANADQDGELFFSVLSGSDSSWTAAQKDLFDAGLFYSRTPLGLSATQVSSDITSTEADALAISFSPDLREAEVIAKQPFTIEIGHGLTETVVLHETAVYRLGRERWLLSPPDNEFWGSQSSHQGSRLRLSTPERDADIAARLLPDLERKLDEMCQSLAEINCPSDLTVEIQFSSDPATLAATKRPLVAEQSGGVLRVNLPAPTLIGIPIDEPGYQALFRGYATQLISAVISHLVDFSCCRHAAFHQALLHHQLSQLSLRPWPITTIDYQRILDEQLQITDIDALWRNEDAGVLTSSEGWRVYAFLDYLLETYPGLSTVIMQRELVRHESIYGWLDDSLSGPADQVNAVSGSDLIRQFWLQAYTQTFSNGNNGEAPAPTQDLQFICNVQDETNPVTSLAKLFRYDLNRDNWSEEYSTVNELFMNPLPDDERLILVEYNSVDRWWQTQLWQEGHVNPLQTGNSQYSVSFGYTDLAGSSLMAFVFPPDGDDAIITLFDLNDCDADGCSFRALPSIPIWSPDGSQAIFTDEPNAQLAILQSRLRTILFDSTAGTPSLQLYHSERENLFAGEAIVSVADLTNMGSGHAPFWLDNETVGYVALANGRFSRPGQELLFTPAGQDDPQLLLTMSDLAETFPEPASVERVFWIHYVMIHPEDPEMLFIVALSGWDQQAHLFTFDRANGEIQHLMENSYAADHTLTLSPDGRYQVLTGRGLNRPGIDPDNALLLLHDLTLNTTTPFLVKPADFPPFPTYDWSSDGEWLAMMLDHNLVGLFSPKHNELRLIESAPGSCSSPAWVNR